MPVCRRPPYRPPPYIDRLASDGVLFERHYTQAAPCAPARASLLTGLYQANHRVIRDERFKYVHFGALPPMLFDLESDPGELNNVAEHPDYLSTRLHYAERMLRWRARHLDQTITGVELAAGGALVADGTRYTPA